MKLASVVALAGCLLFSGVAMAAPDRQPPRHRQVHRAQVIRQHRHRRIAHLRHLIKKRHQQHLHHRGRGR